MTIPVRQFEMHPKSHKMKTQIRYLLLILIILAGNTYTELGQSIDSTSIKIINVRFVYNGFEVKDSAISAFIRFGGDLENNYYEYEIPLKASDIRDATKYSNTSDDYKKLATEKGFIIDGKLNPDIKATEITNWLKEEFELGHGHAMAIYATLKGIKK